MSGTLGLLGIGLLLIVLLVLLLRRSGPASDDPHSISVGGSSVDTLRFEDRRKELLDHIFGPGDWSFVLNHASKDVQRLFLRERKEIALYWLSEIRSRAKAAMQSHVAHARKLEKLQPVLELKLAVDYFAIRVKCGLIAAILLLEGPVALRGFAGHAGGLADQLRGLLEVVSDMNTFQGKSRIPE